MTDTTTTRRVTAADIARAVGVSRATVGFVLNGTPGQTISEATRSRVLETAERLGYRPHTAARALASGRSRLVVFVLPDWPLDFSMRTYLEEASRTLDEAGYSLVPFTRHATGQARPLWESLDPDVVLGVTPFSPEDVASMRASGVRYVYPDPDEVAAADGPAVVDEGPRLQVAHLADLGHRLLAVATADDPRLADLSADRAAAAVREAVARGLPSPDVRPVGLGDGSAHAAVDAWHAAGVTAVVAYNDDVAAAVAGAALRRGLRIPGDLAVIGHDDSPLASVFVPGLSSVRSDTGAAGRFMAEIALNRAEGRPLSSALPDLATTVVARESTVRP